MKALQKRLISFMLTLAMVLSVIPGVVVPVYAAEDYSVVTWDANFISDNFASEPIDEVDGFYYDSASSIATPGRYIKFEDGKFLASDPSSDDAPYLDIFASEGLVKVEITCEVRNVEDDTLVDNPSLGDVYTKNGNVYTKNKDEWDDDFDHFYLRFEKTQYLKIDKIVFYFVPYSVTYDANGATSGTVPVDPNVYRWDSQYTVLGNTGNLKKDGYVFDGWRITSSWEIDNDLSPGSKWWINYWTKENQVLKAKWREMTADEKKAAEIASIAGSGTEADPFIIDTAEKFNIYAKYDELKNPDATLPTYVSIAADFTMEYDASTNVINFNKDTYLVGSNTVTIENGLSLIFNEKCTVDGPSFVSTNETVQDPSQKGTLAGMNLIMKSGYIGSALGVEFEMSGGSVGTLIARGNSHISDGSVGLVLTTNSSPAPSVEITGGTFTGNNEFSSLGAIYRIQNAGTITISGGKFLKSAIADKSTLEGYLAERCEIKEDDNYYEVIKVDKTALIEKITEAEEFYETIKDNEAYTDLATALKTAIDAAKAVRDNDSATSQEVSDEVTALNEALQTAKAGVIAGSGTEEDPFIIDTASKFERYFKQASLKNPDASQFTYVDIAADFTLDYKASRQLKYAKDTYFVGSHTATLGDHLTIYNEKTTIVDGPRFECNLARDPFEQGTLAAMELMLKDGYIGNALGAEFEMTDGNVGVLMGVGNSKISGGTVGLTVVMKNHSNSPDPTLEITGGTFTGIDGEYAEIGAIYHESGTITISGGKFLKSAISNKNTLVSYLAEGYKVIENGDYYEVVPVHVHDWSYAAEGATITATCIDEVDGCDITEGLTLTINAPTALEYDGNAKTATLSEGYNTTAFPGEYTITYEKDGSAIDAADVKNVGTYTAKVSVGDATASVEFTITAVDKTALINAITEAEEFYETIKDNEDYTDIANTLKAAIDTAKEVRDNDNVTKQQVIDATEALKTALAKAKADVKAALDAAEALAAAAKEAAKEALKEKYDGMKDSGEYDEEGLEELKKAYDDAVEAIDAATVTDTQDEPKDNGVWKAEKAGEDALDAVKTRDQKAADAVKELIDALPNPNDVTTGDKDDIEAARKAYDELTDNQKNKLPVDSKDKLEQDEKALADAEELEKAKEDAKKELEEHRNSKDDSKYEPECVDEIDEAKTAGDAAIDDATSLEEVKEALNNAKAAIDAVPTKIEYSVIEGQGSNWEKGSTSGDKFVFKRNVNDGKTYEEFNGVLVDGKAIKSTDYTAESGSVIITLKPEFLETLSVGEHTLTAMFIDGEDVTVPFTVSEKNSQPDDKKDETKPDDKKDETKPFDKKDETKPSDKKDETKPSDQKNNAAKTGDESYMATYIMMFAAALLLAIAIYTSKPYKRNHRM